MLGVAAPSCTQPPGEEQYTGRFEAAGWAGAKEAPRSPASPGWSPRALGTEGADSQDRRGRLSEGRTARGTGQRRCRPAEARAAGVAPPATARAVCAPRPGTLSSKWAGVPVLPTSQTGTPRPRGSQAGSGFECGQPCSEPTAEAPSCAHPGSTEVGGGHEPHSTPRTASCWPHLGSQSHPLGKQERPKDAKDKWISRVCTNGERRRGNSLASQGPSVVWAEPSPPTSREGH